MKLNEVCKETGLTQKTIRFYEEKQLISPASTVKNGRSYREYSHRDVETLREIAILRKAYFSLEEIYIMQRQPDEIERIFDNYLERISAMAVTMQSLSNAAKTLERKDLYDVSGLAQAMDSAVNGLPLPKYDIHPRFKQIDEVELADLDRARRIRQQKQGENPFLLEQQKFTNRLGLFNEHYAHDTSLAGGTANFPAPEEPKALRVVNFILSILGAALIVAIAVFLLSHKIRVVELWSRIKFWMVPSAVSTLTLRAFTGPIYRRRKNIRALAMRFVMLVGILATICISAALWRGTIPPDIPEADVSVVIAVEEHLSDKVVNEMELFLRDRFGDANGDGAVVSEVIAINMLNWDAQLKLYDLIASEDYSLFLVSEAVYERYINTWMPEEGLMELPERLQSNHSPVLCEVSETFGYDDLAIYGFVLEYGGQKQEISMEILENLK